MYMYLNNYVVFYFILIKQLILVRVARCKILMDLKNYHYFVDLKCKMTIFCFT